MDNDNTYSKTLLEALFNNFSTLTWQSLDQSAQRTRKTPKVSDYEVRHRKMGLTVIELKELKDSRDIQKQQAVVDAAQEQLKGLFPDIAFDGHFDAKGLPSQQQIALFKKFLKVKGRGVTAPCRIVLPEDPISPMVSLVEIQRLDHEGNLIERLYSPATRSGKYPRGKRAVENFRKLRDRCVVIDGRGRSVHEEREVFLERERAPLSLISTTLGKGGSIYCHGVGGWFAEDDRIRDRIKSAGVQLKVYRDLKCPLGCVICPSGFKFASFDDLVDALMGNCQIAVELASDRKRRTKLIRGGGRMLQYNKNTNISYCGWLDNKGGKPNLSIFHNDFSAQRLPYAFFDGPSTKQFIIKYQIGKGEVIGSLVEVTSSKQLSNIRTSNQRPIALMRNGLGNI